MDVLAIDVEELRLKININTRDLSCKLRVHTELLNKDANIHCNQPTGNLQAIETTDKDNELR